MSFQSFKKSIKKILNGLKYGDEHRSPLVYLKTNTHKSSSYYELPIDIVDEPLSSYKAFPKVSEKILISLFSAIGVHYVPEVVLYELNIKTAQKAFIDFCVTFGMEDNEMINSLVLNQVIDILIEMDELRSKIVFDSRPIYRALANRDFEEAKELINIIRIDR